MRYSKLLVAGIMFGLLAGCMNNATGPVVIRDASTGAASTTHGNNGNRSVESRKTVLETQPSASPNSVTVETHPSPNKVQPVLPQSTINRASLNSPLKNKLLSQSQQQLNNEEPNNAIRLAERGLRIDRKEPGFYVVLAKSYQLLGNASQSQQFAAQGLRYAPRDSQYYRELKRLAR